MILLQDQMFYPVVQTTTAVNDTIGGTSGMHDTINELKELSLNDLLDNLSRMLVNFAIDVAIAIIVFYVGKFIIKRIYNLVGSIMVRRQVDNSLSTFVLSFIKIVMYFILIVTVIGILGIETTSFLALFASAGVAIGMALSGTLQNFAGGVLILFLKPYKVGDYIEAQGFAGTVREIQIFHTLISTYDNKAILIPNGILSTSSINNWSREVYRRVQWDVAISYGDKVDDARTAILNLFNDDKRVVTYYVDVDGDGFDDNTGERLPEGIVPAPEKEAEPEPKRSWWYRLFHRRPDIKGAFENLHEAQEKKIQQLRPKVTQTPAVVVSELGDSGVKLSVRVWTRCEYYWEVFYEYNEKIYSELPKHNVRFPFPQMDVHIKPKD